jgi:hypothetical protein
MRRFGTKTLPAVAAAVLRRKERRVAGWSGFMVGNEAEA